MTKRTLLFRIAAIALLLVISGCMMIIGRGHTIYLDNKTLEHGGQTYTAPYKIEVSVGGKQVAKLYSKERGMSTCIGQKFDMTLEITSKKGGDKEVRAVTLSLPYSMDGIAINLPAYLAGLPEDVYLSEFQIAVEEPDSSEADAPIDEFAIPEAEVPV